MLNFAGAIIQGYNPFALLVLPTIEAMAFYASIGGFGALFGGIFTVLTLPFALLYHYGRRRGGEAQADEERT